MKKPLTLCIAFCFGLVLMLVFAAQAFGWYVSGRLVAVNVPPPPSDACL